MPWRNPPLAGSDVTRYSPDQMNLPMNMTTMGWLHTGFALCALAIGAAVVVGPKGTPTHKLLGRLYVARAEGLIRDVRRERPEPPA